MNINQENLQASLRFLDKIGEANVETMKNTDPEQAARLEQMGKLFSDEDFCKQLVACDGKESAIKLFEDNGFDITSDELDLMDAQIKAIVKTLVENDGLLGEDELEMVAGGWSWKAFWICVGTGAAAGAVTGSVIISLGWGTLIGAVVGALIGAAMGVANQM